MVCDHLNPRWTLDSCSQAVDYDPQSVFLMVIHNQPVNIIKVLLADFCLVRFDASEQCAECVLVSLWSQNIDIKT